MENNVKILKLIIFLGSLIFCFSQKTNQDNNYIFEHYNPLEEDIIDIKEDEFLTDKLNYNKIKSYKFLILNNTDEIFFDFQSEFGCLYINIDKEESNNSDSSDFEFCSKGVINIFSLKKNEIIEKFENKEIDSLINITLNIQVGYSSEEKTYNFIFDYSLKVSLRKPVINVFKINSAHKILCKTEKITENNYRCIFMAVNHYENDENIIIYSKPINDITKLNIYANFINKIEYDTFNIEYLSNNIPNETTNYTNYNNNRDFIIIPKREEDKYIYISIESSIETTIELLNKNIKNDNSFPKEGEIKIYSINNTKIDIDLNYPQDDLISLTIITLNGKGNITLDYINKRNYYITDTIDNKLDIKLNKIYCMYSIECKLTINSLDDDEEKELGFIFYIYYTPIVTSKPNRLNELTYGKSSKLLRKYYPTSLIFYQKIEDINSPLNINFQLYNLEENVKIQNFQIDIKIVSKNIIHLLKLKYDDIGKYDTLEEGKFDPVLAASNIYLNLKEILDTDSVKEPYLLIYFKSDVEDLVIGSTISQANSLIYSSERIYHYGKLNNEEKIVYRLKGNKKYNLMRLEFGANNKNIDWTVKRTNNNITYIKNDTDLSFVQEKWINGRELLTMYIEHGEDIYLTIFSKNKIKNNKITNYAFKYINSAKNGDFKNYLIKADSLDYNKKKHLVSIKKLQNIPKTSTVNYFIKIISEEYYYKEEILKTISITESKCDYINKTSNDDNIIFNITSLIKENTYYYINAYSIVNDNDDYEYVSYSNIKIKYVIKQVKESNVGLIIAALTLAGLTFLIIVTRCVWYCCCKRRRRNYNHYDYYYHDNLLY